MLMSNRSTFKSTERMTEGEREGGSKGERQGINSRITFLWSDCSFFYFFLFLNMDRSQRQSAASQRMSSFIKRCGSLKVSSAPSVCV